MKPPNGKNDSKGPLQLLVPLPPTNFAERGKLLVPTRMSTAEVQKKMEGIGYAAVALSYRSMFGEELSFEAMKHLASTLNRQAALKTLACAACALAINGAKPIKDDGFQATLAAALVDYGARVGLTVGPEASKIPPERLYFFNPDAINGALSLVLTFARDDMPDDESKIQNLSALLAAMNSEVFNSTPDFKSDPDGFYLSMIRQLFVQSPQLVGIRGLGRRFHRLIQLSGNALSQMPSKLRQEVDQVLKKQLGVTFQEWLESIFPLNVNWMLSNEKNYNVLNELSKIESASGRARMSSILPRLSLTLDAYREKMQNAYKLRGERFFLSAEAIRALVSTPFASFNEDTFLLLAPHLLIRKMDLCATSAKPKGAKVDEFYSYFGHAFELHCSRLLERVSERQTQKNSIITGNLLLNPPGKDGNEITDAITLDDRYCALLEMKNRPANFSKHLDPLNDTDQLKKWLYEVFVAEKNSANGIRAGALRQLASAARKVTNGELGQKVAHIVPVVVIPDEMITEHMLYQHLDPIVERLEIFKGLELVRPYLIISVDSLEYLTSMKIPDKNWTLQRILHEKSVAEGAREMNWSKFLEEIKLKYVRHEEEEQALDKVVDDAIKQFQFKLPDEENK